MAKAALSIDPTIAAIRAAMELAQDSRPRAHLGASQIGKKCSRALWMQFRHAAPVTFFADTLCRFDDGHRSEDIVAERIRMLPELELHTHDAKGNQFRFSDHGGHFAGSADGFVKGLKHAPEVPHVWEHKCVNEAKFRKLDKLKSEKGEGNALAHWDEIYHAQAQVYMHYFHLKHHWLTCATPGSRDLTSVLTEYSQEQAEYLIRKAGDIIASQTPPSRISDKPDYFECKWCDYIEQCHHKMIVDANCRTCRHSQPVDGGWWCNKHSKSLDFQAQRDGCPDWQVIDGLHDLETSAA